MTEQTQVKDIEREIVDVNKLTHDDLARMLSHRFCIKCSINIDNEPNGVQYCKECRNKNNNYWNKEQREKKLSERGVRLCIDCGLEIPKEETLNAKRCKKCRENRPGHLKRDEDFSKLSEEEKLQVMAEASKELLQDDENTRVFEQLFRKRIENSLKRKMEVMERKGKKRGSGNGSVGRCIRRAERKETDPEYVERLRAKRRESYKKRKEKIKNNIVVENFG